jgi:hypothetical protein
MNRVAAIAALLAALAFAGGEALAFQEMPAPPPAGESQNAPQQAAPQVDPLQVGTPGTAQPSPKSDQGGLKMFGYTVLPKLNFGLDVLYGKDEQQLQLGSQGPSTLEENGDISVLGKVKRRF